MTNLAALQHALQQHILTQGADQTAVRWVRDQQRLVIYTDMYTLRLQEILATEFAALRVLLGEEHFAELSAAYIKLYPSRHFSSRYFPQHFADFMQQHTGNSLWVDIARFEWALSLAQDANDVTTVQVAALQAVPPEQWPNLTVRFHPAVQCVVSAWDIAAWWTAVDQQQALPPLDYATEQKTCLVWRYQQQPYYQLLTPTASVCIQHGLAGRTFAQLCDALCEQVPETEVAQVVLAQWLWWINQDMISEICVLTDTKTI